MPKYTEDELAMLTPEERAGVLDKDPDPAEEDHKRQQAELAADGDDAEDDDDQEDADESKDEPENEAKDDDKPESDAKPAGEGSQDESQQGDAKAEPAAPREARVPQFTMPEAQRDFGKEIADIQKLYEEGEISNAEYTAKLLDIGSAKATAELIPKLNQDMAASAWAQAQEDFYASHPEYNKAGLRAALDVHVQRLDDGKLGNGALLAKAHAALQEELGVTATAPSAKPAAPKLPDRSEAAGRAKALNKAPKTLADVPTAEDAPDTTGDKFAHLDNLGGLALESALAKLSPAEVDEYLART